jgi:riboflavin biosynthesis pyrimidine reductase
VLGQLIDAELLDELFLTLTPIVTGEADAPRVVEGMSEGPREFELVDVLTADGDLFTRYRPRR